MKSSLPLSVVLLVTTNLCYGAPIAWPIGSGGNGHAYDQVFQQLTWHDARLAAMSLAPPPGYQNGHLVTFSGPEELSFVASNFVIPSGGEDDGAWAGMTDEQVEGEWHWIDSTPGIWQDPNYFAVPVQTAFVMWDGSEPNNLQGEVATGEDFLSIRNGGAFNDFDAISRFDLSYLVEFEPIPEPSSLALCGFGVSGLLVAARRRR